MARLTSIVGLIALSASLVHGKVYTDLEQLDSAKESYDFIVVGGLTILNTLSCILLIDRSLEIGGVGGSVVASRLSENPRYNVLLVEAGPELVFVFRFLSRSAS
jgi:choline dehydrogenase